MEKIPMTREGSLVLEAELKKLKSVERPNIIQAISEAREHGDLSENAEYHSAREKQSFIEGRIKEIEAIIFSATEPLDLDTIESKVSKKVVNARYIAQTLFSHTHVNLTLLYAL